jgi:cell shape-determining protein MreD
MIARRLIAASAAILTVLVLQAVVLTPLVVPLAISLPAVLVATVGVEVGVSAGLSVGFSVGLLADLASRHPAGVLALAWLLLGGGCGLLAEPRRRLLLSAIIVTLASGLCGLVTFLALNLLDAPAGSLRAGIALSGPSTIGDAALALLMVAAVRAVLRALRVRAPVVGSRATGPVGIVRPHAVAGRVAVDG